MRDVVAVEISGSPAKVAALFADPRNNPLWMEKTRYEPLSGEQGEPGSRYRLIMQDGKMTFDVTMLERELPKHAALLLEAPTVVVHVDASFVAVGPDRTRLVSEELFEFRGLLNKAFGLLARRSIRRAHRGQMESFKRFAEQEA